MDSISRTKRGHGRKETRIAYTTDDVSWQPGGRQWPVLTCIGAFHTRFETNKGVPEEWHYYISSKALRAEELLHHAREEWSVESMHWLLDVHFDEENFCVNIKTSHGVKNGVTFAKSTGIKPFFLRNIEKVIWSQSGKLLQFF